MLIARSLSLIFENLLTTYSVGFKHLYYRKSRKILPEFPQFLGNIVVHERNLDTWEFGKGALSANVYFFGNHYGAIEAAAKPVLG